MDAPLSTLANIVVPAMLVGLVYLLYHVNTKRPESDAGQSSEDIEERGY